MQEEVERTMVFHQFFVRVARTFGDYGSYINTMQSKQYLHATFIRNYVNDHKSNESFPQ